MNKDKNRALAAFLRARRARLTPEDVGLVRGNASGRRRTPGLRREEVAELSGVGVTWYTWLEQGRDITTSGQVIDALARALLLDTDQHWHLRELAGLPPPERPAPARSAEGRLTEDRSAEGRPEDDGPAEDDGVAPRLRLLVDGVMPNPASVYDRYFDYVAWNQAYARVRSDPASLPPGRRNMLWMMFTDPVNRARMVHWATAARAALGQFRAAADRHAGDPRFTELTAALSAASPEFREWWAEYPVRHFRPATIALRHSDAGELALELFQFRPLDRPDLVALIQVPADPESAVRVRSLLPFA